MARKAARERYARSTREFYARTLPPPDDGLRGWMISTARKHFWRVSGWITFDDLIGEGDVLYCKCRAKYGQRLEAKHFMALYQRSWPRRITDLARERTKHSILVTHSEPDGEGNGRLVENIVSQQADDWSATATLIAEAPPVVRDFLKLFTGEGAAKLRQPFKVFTDGTRETTNQFLTRILGLSIDLDIIGMTRAYLTGGD